MLRLDHVIRWRVSDALPSLARAASPATAAYSLDAPVDKWLTEAGQRQL